MASYCLLGRDKLRPTGNDWQLFCKMGEDTLIPSECFTLLFPCRTQTNTLTLRVSPSSVLLQNTNRQTDSLCFTLLCSPAEHRHTDSLCFNVLCSPAEHKQTHCLSVFHPPLFSCRTQTDTLTPCVSTSSVLLQNTNRYTVSPCFTLLCSPVEHKQTH